jgi:hypothetical protein
MDDLSGGTEYSGGEDDNAGYVFPYEIQSIEPGALIVYRRGFDVPTRVPIPNFPNEILAQRGKLEEMMEYSAGVSQLMVTGNTPNGIKSGVAIESLREIDNTRLSLTGDNIRAGIKNMACLWLKIYKKYANTRRAVQSAGMNNIAQAVTWSNEDITSFDVSFTTENELLLSDEVQKQRFFEAYNLGLFADSNGVIPERVKYKAREYMKTDDYAELMSLDSLQMQSAQRENTFFENNIIPQISDFDNHIIHYEEHMRYILQMKFTILKMKKPEWAKIMEAHTNQHKQILMQIEQQNQLMKMQNEINSHDPKGGN